MLLLDIALLNRESRGANQWKKLSLARVIKIRRRMMLNAAALLPLLVILVTISYHPCHSIITTEIDTFVYGGCSRQKYQPNSPYQSNVDSFLTSAVNSAAYSSYNNYTITGTSSDDVVYGLYQCRGDLSMTACATCVARAVTQIGTLCSATCGGAVQLQGCYLKYDNATFLGVEDKTVVLKKCGPNAAAGGVMVQRDAVLTSLSGEDGVYRVSGSGQVQGVAQCVADLSVGECQDCVSEAVARLRTDCATALYGDMYLAKCYVQYSSGGANVDDNYSPHDNYHNNNDGESNDEGEKTFAIIIGLLAGVALLIIFLAFIRNVVEGHRDESGK